MIITAEQSVEDIANYLVNSQTPNELLSRIGIIPELRKLRGIVPYCVNAARFRSQQLGIAGGTIAVDGESVLCAIAYAASGVDKLPEKALASIRKIHKINESSHLIVAFDDVDNFRKKICKEFKSSRSHDEIKNLIDNEKANVIDNLRSHGIQVEVAKSREADDILASVATQCQILGTECIMVTEDRDCWQALGPKTTMYSRKNDIYHGMPWLEATHKIKPQQVVDWMVIVGKNGLHGADGIAGATASNLLALYGDFFGIIENASEKQVQSLKKIDYWTARSVHTLDRRIPIARY